MIEGSKSFAKQVMTEAGIPTAASFTCATGAEADQALAAFGPPYVVKDDALAAGKGVLVTEDLAAARAHARACGTVVIEEFLHGPEVSLFAVTDGVTAIPLLPAQDFKRARDGDTGPNTGGMGAYAPVPMYDEALAARVRKEIIEPTFEGMRSEGIAGAGVLYFGLMITKSGPKVLEYNCRFGDPETQAILPLFAGDLAQAMFEAAGGRFGNARFENGAGAAACIVLASKGYPGAYDKGHPIEGLDRARDEGCIVFHAGTAARDGAVVTNGGRVLGVTATGPTLRDAVDAAYRGAAAISFTGCFSRSDIGKKGLR
jgi:phosphoribosylamine--glycine ligase